MPDPFRRIFERSRSPQRPSPSGGEPSLLVNEPSPLRKTFGCYLSRSFSEVTSSTLFGEKGRGHDQGRQISDGDPPHSKANRPFQKANRPFHKANPSQCKKVLLAPIRGLKHPQSKFSKSKGSGIYACQTFSAPKGDTYIGGKI